MKKIPLIFLVCILTIQAKSEQRKTTSLKSRTIEWGANLQKLNERTSVKYICSNSDNFEINSFATTNYQETHYPLLKFDEMPNSKTKSKLNQNTVNFLYYYLDNTWYSDINESIRIDVLKNMDRVSTRPTTSKILARIKSGREIRQIIEKWRDQVKPTIPPNLIAKIEAYASNYPLETPSGKPDFVLNINNIEKDKSCETKPEPNRRDIAYAVCGAGSAMLGNYEGQELHIDIAFWCFLEAALLKLEPDYLSNISFFLIEKEAYVDAIDLLSYAKSKDKYNYGILCNLAYIMALKGQFEQAVDHQKNAMAMHPSSKHIKNRLKAYAKEAGVDVYIPADEPPNEPGESSGPERPTQPFPPDYLPSAKFPTIFSKITKITWTNWSQNIYGKWSKEVFDPVHGLPNCSDNKHYEREDRNREEESKCKKACAKNRGAVGEDISQCICNCDIQLYRGNLDSNKQVYSEAVPAYSKFRREAHAGNETALEEMVMIINDNINDIYAIEVYFVGEFIQDNYLFNYEAIGDMYKDLNSLWDNVQMAEENLDRVQQRCNKLRMALRPKLKPEDFFAKAPTIMNIKRVKDPYANANIFFWYGSMRLNSDGSTFLSVSPTKKGISLKGKYNYKTNEWGAGVGIDLGAAKLAKGASKNLVKMWTSSGFTAFYDSKTGFSADVSAKIRPKIGYWGGELPSVSLKIYH